MLIALPKGRLGDQAVARLAPSALALDPATLATRALRVPTALPGVEVLLLKGHDLVRYVSAGIAALGVVGSDTLDETPADVLELGDLGFGACRLSLCAPQGVSLADLRKRPHLRLATKFPQATGAWLAHQTLTAEIVNLESSVELAPLLGLADAMVDLVQTGATLAAHGLSEIELLGKSSARLIASRAALLTAPQEVGRLRELLETALQSDRQTPRHAGVKSFER